MAFSLTWLADVLKSAGLKVSPVDGWQERGRGDVGQTFGIICHHTAGGKTGNMSSLKTILEGRPASGTSPALPGPLAQLGLGRDGTFYIIAAGRCNHAGAGIWKGITSGNTNFIGIEAENMGTRDDFPWPDVQVKAYQQGVAAILKHIGRDAGFCAGHKEYALPRGRKSDPDFDMVSFRAAVQAILDGNAAPVTLIPKAEPPGPAGEPGRPTLRRGDSGEFVKQLQAKLGITADGIFGASTEATLRNFQRNHATVPDGIVGPKTWIALDGHSSDGG